MKFLIKILLILCSFHFSFAQDGFIFPKNSNKVTIPFKLINNLVIIPIEVNDVKLNFLLDTGVEETILFSLEDKEEIKFSNIEKIKLRGLGSQNFVEGLKSSKNKLVVGGLAKTDQNILIVIDENMDFSSSLGIPVNGIVGYHFFNKNLVEINYSKHKIHIYKRSKKKLEKIAKDFTSIPITIEKNKPYLETKVAVFEETFPAKLLLDTGNSDAIWLFQNVSDKISVPEKNFDDFLGRGFSGEIYGKKARINSFSIQDFYFKDPIASFPDTTSIQNVKMVPNRLGSIGGEVFKRFVVIFDYTNNMFYAKKNGNFTMPFYYNMSGIELHHAGLRLVQEPVMDNAREMKIGSVKIDFGDAKFNMRYKFELKPAYEIASIRKNSPAEKVGLKKGDILISVDNAPTHKYSLQEINEMLRSKPGKTLELEIEREGQIQTYKLKLENIL